MFISLYIALSSMLGRLRSDDGQTMAEYGILIGVIAVVVVAVAFIFGNSIAGIFSNTSQHL